MATGLALALQLERDGDRAGAMAVYREILSREPDHLGALNNLSLLLLADRQTGAAAELCVAARLRHPDSVELANTMAEIESGRGQVETAITILEDAWNRHPDHLITGSNLLLNMNYSEYSPAAMLSAHLRWDQCCRELHGNEPAFSVTSRSGAAVRRYRIGYLSADFRRHSVAFFLEALFHYHDRNRFEIHLFADVNHPDYVTERFRGLGEYWHDLSGKSNAEVAAYIRRQELDVLVDLAGHTGRRMEVFAVRAAPIQVTWLGYPNTTGLKNMDWRLTDDLADPPEFDGGYAERQWRLPGGMWAYSPPEDVAEPAAPPCRQRGYFTFGSFNQIAKISVATERLWAAVLRTVPDSRLLLKNRALADASVAAGLRQRLERVGIAPERLMIRTFNPSLEAHLREYDEIDLALDTWPYNGTTTTFESLWMGVPVLTMTGTGHASRTGAAIMGRLGLNRFIAASRRDLVGKATALAAAPELLTELRRKLRPLLADSSLCDGRRLAAELEEFYRSVIEV